MARLATWGFETRQLISLGLDGEAQGSAPVFDTSVFRSGSASLKCGNAGAAGNSYCRMLGATPSAVNYFRAYVRFANWPTLLTTFMQLGSVAGEVAAIKIGSTGIAVLHNDATDAQIGNALQLSLNVWYRCELAVTLGTNNATAISGQIEGIPFGTVTGLNIAVSTPFSTAASWNFGWTNSVPASTFLYVDDCAINDSLGANENSWPGEGGVVLLVPTADSAGGTGWTLGTGTALAGNGFAAVANKPPVGVADLAAGSDPKQIRNAANSANSSYDATLQSYTAAGVPLGARVVLIDPVVYTAAPVSTSAKAGTVGVVSNPAIANVALSVGGTAGAFWSGVAGGAFPTGWKLSHGTLTYVPTVTPGTAPVMRLTQVTGSTRIATACFMGLIVEYRGHYPSGGLVMGGSAVVARIFSKTVSAGLRLGGSVVQQRVYPQTPSGGVRLGGSVVQQRVYPQTPSSGVRLGGTVAVTRTSSSSVSAGLRLAGSVSSPPVYTQTPSGGLKLNGSVAQAKTLTSTRTAGVVLNGSRVVIRTLAAAPSAGVRLDGSVALARIVTLTRSGGLVLGGTRTSVRVMSPAPSSGIRLNGACDSIRQLADQSVPVGGIHLAGVASSARTVAISRAAGVRLGGSVVVVRTLSNVRTGGVRLGGSTVFVRAYVYARSGGIRLAGLRVQSKSYARALSGGLVLGGTRTSARRLSLSRRGGIVLAGAAASARTLVLTRTGGVRLAGSVQTALLTRSRAVSDVLDGGWVDQAGGHNLWAAIDELTPNDADYIHSSVSPVTPDVCQVRLRKVVDPVASTLHVVEYRYGSSADGFVTVTHVLSGAQADAITDYKDLSLVFEAQVT